MESGGGPDGGDNMVKTKQCRDCKADIPKDAKKCMHCGSKQGIGVVGGVVAILFTLLVIGWVSNAVNPNSPNPAMTSPGTSHQMTAQERAAQQASEKKERDAQRINTGRAWITSDFEDKVSGKQVHTKSLRSTNTINLGFPYQGEQRASLTVRSHPRFGKGILLEIERGQMLCSSYDGCNVTVRFGKHPPVKYKASGAADGSSNVLFIRNYKAFVANMHRVEQLVIAPTIYQAGGIALEFSVGSKTVRAE